MKARTQNSLPGSGPLRGVHARFRHVRKTGVLAILAASSAGFTGNALAGEHEQSLQPTVASATNPHVSVVTKFRHWLETGTASWYGHALQGHRTASGEHFDMNLLTCAHRTLPMGSWLRVTNLRNHKTVLVRVNDRGPLGADRIVDLSYAAAHILGLDGVGKVKLEAVAPDAAESAKVRPALFMAPPIQPVE